MKLKKLNPLIYQQRQQPTQPFFDTSLPFTQILPPVVDFKENVTFFYHLQKEFKFKKKKFFFKEFPKHKEGRRKRRRRRRIIKGRE